MKRYPMWLLLLTLGSEALLASGIAPLYQHMTGGWLWN